MNFSILPGLVLPLLGTTLGAALVFFLKGTLNELHQRCFLAMSAGVMAAASVWSLLDPAIDMSLSMGRLAFAPAFAGFWAGVLFLYVLDSIVPHLHRQSSVPEGLPGKLKRNTMLMIAVTLHNLPEGMAVGVVYAGRGSGAGISEFGALSLALGIAFQNFPEGAVVSLPMAAEGASRPRAFFCGFLSGAVEPCGMLATILLASYLTPVMPYLLSFAAGAMFYVIIEELMPEVSRGEHTNLTTLVFCGGFSLMMALDAALG